MSGFQAKYPEYADTIRIDELRAAEYSYLDECGHVYLDYTGAGLPSRSQLREHTARITASAFGNPHSENPTSSVSTRLVEQTRADILRHFNTTQDDYAVIFTPNATGALRLVGESYPFGHGGRFMLTADNHNSVNGIREFARSRGAKVAYVPLTVPDLRVDEPGLLAALGGRSGGRRNRAGLFAYPAQSNFTGVQHPLSWVSFAQERGWDVLLDAAAYVPANALDLSAVRPEFVAVSWYKVFGYPTGVGSLLVRRDALSRLRRPWFSGGTIWGVSVQGRWHRMLNDEGAFEDGTVNFLSIPDVSNGLDLIDRVGIDLVHQRVGILTGWLLKNLSTLKHGNGRPMIQVYGPSGMTGRGGTISFNLLDPAGRVIDERAVARDSSAAGISLRTGCFCNPGAGEWAFGLSRKDVRGPMWRALLTGGSSRQSVATVDDYLTRIGLPTGGAVRASVGIVSNVADVDAFLDFAEHAYRDREADMAGLAPRLRC